MLTAVLAEDQPLALKSLVQRVEKSKVPVKIVSAAPDGRAAWEAIQSLRPDFLITDIKMPVMDGLTLIQTVRDSGNTMPILILSGFEEFEYAQRAMRLGIQDYILKPLTQDKIDDALQSVADTLEQERNAVMKAALGELLSGTPIRSEKGSEYLENVHLFPICICTGSYTDAGDFSEKSLYSQEHFLTWRSQLAEALPFSGQYQLFYGLYPDTDIVCIYFCGKDVTPPNLLLPFKHLVGMASFPITAALGTQWVTWAALVKEVQKNRETIRNGLKFGQSSILSRGSIPATDSAPISIALEQEFATLLDHARYDRLEEFFNRVCSEWHEHGARQEAMQRGFMRLNRLLQNSWGSSEIQSLQLDRMSASILSTQHEYPALLRQVFEAYHSICLEHIRHCGTDSPGDIVLLLDEYIKVHFTEALAIQDLAEMVHLSPAYISRLFKKKTGQSPMERITTLRIERAKQLILGNQDLSMGDIARMSGYQDPFYFSKLFKEACGVAPMQYRKSGKSM